MPSTKSPLRAVSIIAVATVFIMLCSQAVAPQVAFGGGYLTLDSFSGMPGSSIVVSGGGWNAGDTVTFYAGTAGTVPLGTATVGDDATFTARIVIPANEPQGSLPIIGVDSTNQYSSDNSYYVEPLSPVVQFTTDSHTPNATVQVSGSGFAPDEGIQISLARALATTTTDATGSFTGTIVVPMTNAGLYHVAATGTSSGASNFDYFWIDTFYPSLTPSVWYAVPGSTITVSAAGYAPNESIIFALTTPTANATLATTTATTSSTGTVTAILPIPYVSGIATMTGTGQLSHARSSVSVQLARFIPTITPGSWFAYPGQSVSFAGSGFIPGERVTTRLGTTAATSSIADATGSITLANITVPYTAKNSITETFLGAQSLASSSITIAIGTLSPYLTADAYSAAHGSTTHVQGVNFAPGETVFVFAGSFTSTTTADQNGNTTALTIPLPYHAGSQLVQFVGTSSHVRASVRISLQKYKPYLTLSSYYTQRGSTVTVTGNDYAAGEIVYISNTVATTSVSTAADGSFSATVSLPATAPPSIKVRATGETSGATATVAIAFAPYVPQVTPSAYYALPGSGVTFTGAGYAPGEMIRVVASGTLVSTIPANDSGAFSFNYVVPYGATSALFTFTGVTSGAHASDTLSIGKYSAYMTLSTYYGMSGSAVTITGNGFSPNENVDISFSGTVFATTAATASGSIVLTTALPYSPAGTIPLSAIGEKSATKAGVTYVVAKAYPSFQLGAYAGAPGTTVNFLGSNFYAYEPVQVITDRTGTTSIATFFTDASGSFNDSHFQLPLTLTEGAIVFTATGLHSLTPQSITFYVSGN